MKLNVSVIITTPEAGNVGPGIDTNLEARFLDEPRSARTLLALPAAARRLAAGMNHVDHAAQCDTVRDRILTV
jgi:hypothetical protein